MFIFFKILSKLPLRKLYFFSDLINKFFLFKQPYRKKITFNNLNKVFNNKTKKEIELIYKQFYNHLTDLILETIKLLDIDKKTIKKRIKLLNPEIVNSLDENKPTIILSAHYGNWEWLFASLCVNFKENIYAIYKPLSNEFFNNLILKIRGKFGGKLISKNKAGKFILKKFKEKKILFVLADQVPENLNNTISIKFLNRNTTFSKGLEKLCLNSNAVVLYAKMEKKNRGYYTVEFSKVRKNIIKEFAKKTENSIFEKPEYWLWSHNRWKR